MKIGAGKRDQRIRIERNTSTPDPDYGTPSAANWVEVAKVWAEVQDVLPSKSESQGSGLRVQARPARIRTAWMTGITSDMRVVLLDQGDRIMQITAGPAILGRKEGLEFMAEEYSTEGGV